MALQDALQRANMHVLTKISIKIFENEATAQKSNY